MLILIINLIHPSQIIHTQTNVNYSSWWNVKGSEYEQWCFIFYLPEGKSFINGEFQNTAYYRSVSVLKCGRRMRKNSWLFSVSIDDYIIYVNTLTNLLKVVPSDLIRNHVYSMLESVIKSLLVFRIQKVTTSYTSTAFLFCRCESTLHLWVCRPIHPSGFYR